MFYVSPGYPWQMIEEGFLPSPSALYSRPFRLIAPWGILMFSTVIPAIFSDLSSQILTLSIFNILDQLSSNGEAHHHQVQATEQVGT